jgi:hypothetical protein
MLTSSELANANLVFDNWILLSPIIIIIIIIIIMSKILFFFLLSIDYWISKLMSLFLEQQDVKLLLNMNTLNPIK